MTIAELIERPQAKIWTPFGELLSPPDRHEPANDNRPIDAEEEFFYDPRTGRVAGDGDLGLALPPLRSVGTPLLIGLTGLRNVGKSTVAKLLEEEFGFERVHAFDAGKAAAYHFFDYVVGDVDVAYAMVYGDLKDVPSPHLPGNVAPRLFLERFGEFMGAGMGVDWTLGLEIARVRKRNPRTPIVVESLVYEAGWFKAQGGLVLRLERPGHVGPAGVASDSVQATIAADMTIATNDLDALKRRAREVVQQMVGGA